MAFDVAEYLGITDTTTELLERDAVVRLVEAILDAGCHVVSDPANVAVLARHSAGEALAVLDPEIGLLPQRLGHRQVPSLHDDLLDGDRRRLAFQMLHALAAAAGAHLLDQELPRK